MAERVEEIEEALNVELHLHLSQPPTPTLTPTEINQLFSNASDKHPLRPYLDYVGFLYQRMDPLPEQERFELGYRDFLQSPLQVFFLCLLLSCIIFPLVISFLNLYLVEILQSMEVGLAFSLSGTT
ncbi:uncharacterized protein LOC133738658 [Rosa rugosa]|uniref:uncharacterized protein LOC133738658 n=1 Tax=Rosa rugosa TaxID=74645 RepID=UPI002B4071B2|nr:uncharacterized protein LOC133738658 [Rosa rugosa]